MRDAFDRLGDGWHKLLAAGLSILGLACLAFVAILLARDLSIWVFGQRVMADVVDKWTEAVEDSQVEMPQFQYFIRYQFTASNGQVITRVASVSVNEWAEVAEAPQSVTRAFGGSGGAPVHQEGPLVHSQTAGGMEAGGQVAVIYFSLYPEYNRLDDSRYVAILACAYIPLILVGLGCLWAGLRGLRASGRLVSSDQLRQHQVRLAL